MQFGASNLFMYQLAAMYSSIKPFWLACKDRAKGFSRRFSEKGRKNVSSGEFLRNIRMNLDIVLCSPAAFTTAD